jgi:hypothetical protein
MNKASYLLILLLANSFNLSLIRADQSTATYAENTEEQVSDDLEISLDDDTDANLHDEIFGPSDDADEIPSNTIWSRTKRKVKNFCSAVALYVLIKMIDLWDSLPSFKKNSTDSGDDSVENNS